MDTSEKIQCWACKKLTRRFVSKAGVPAGKRRIPHLCPHGNRCLAGTKEGSQGYNGPPLGGQYYCRGCHLAALERQKLEVSSGGA